jgi:hypothetical protein
VPMGIPSGTGIGGTGCERMRIYTLQSNEYIPAVLVVYTKSLPAFADVASYALVLYGVCQVMKSAK